MGDSKKIERIIGQRERLRLANELIGLVSENRRRKEELEEVAKRLPALVLNSGALMTFSYLLKRAQSGNEATSSSARLLIKYIMKWLRRRNFIGIDAPDLNSNEWRDFPGKLVNELLKKDSLELAWITDEMLWFAEGLRILMQAHAGWGEGSWE